ncbi:hypothetical protein Pmani_024112 [Petrolisthes manimaculis]|uniref:Molybdenum cofactor sulfurase n=1 Tax=Petrolisthes manimaculis TaxID=1843537 RepID=A0AAE1U0C8_9EUCA|nr:hypothetical protein Pmani_024112 [Petrolisthes manimaculis]
MDSNRLEKLKVPCEYNVDQLVATEFPKLKGEYYLDHAAATLYSSSQLRNVFTELESSLLGNPHSRHQPSDTVTQIIETIRQRILEHFNTSAENYDVIFTSGATAALKVVAESFDWGGHNQVSREAGTNTCCISQENSKGHKDHPSSQNANDSEGRNGIKRHHHHHQVWDGNVKESRKERNENGCFRGEECLEGHKQLLDGNVSESGKEKGIGQFKRKYVPAYSHLLNQNGDNNTLDEGDTYPGAFLYIRENHTSVLGIRGLAHQAGCDVYSVPNEEIRNILKDSAHPTTTTTGKSMNGNCEVECRKRNTTKRRNCLFAFSGQCNFSGAKYPLGWIDRVQAGELSCILDTPPINGTSGREMNGLIADERCDTEWFVLLDAAGLVATSPLDLTHYRPDFVPISFYKMFGYPTGLGCLLVSQRAWGVMRKSYQGGGTVMVADSRTMTLIPRPLLHDRFEDGTLPYLSILAVRHGFDTLTSLTGGMEKIREHTFHLARYTHHSLRSLRHACGSLVVQIYCPWGDDIPWHHHTHGPIINFTLLKADGSHVGYAQVERVATLYNIHLRTGCLCNPGACQMHLNISEEQLLRQFEAGHVCGDAHDLVDGQPTGSVRVSFGYMSTYTDADQLLRMVRECFVQGTPRHDTTWMTGRLDGIGGGEEYQRDIEHSNTTNSENTKYTNTASIENTNHHDHPPLDRRLQDTVIQLEDSNEYLRDTEHANTEEINSTNTTKNHHHRPPPNARLRLTDIFLYPVKSCGCQQVEKWHLGCSGLEYDRGWMVVTEAGVTLTQKRAPHMALISPLVDINSQTLVLRCKGKEDISVPLDPESTEESEAGMCGGRVCGDRVRGQDCGQEVGHWLSQVLELPGLRLMRQTTHRTGRLGSRYQSTEGEIKEKLSLANESQLLILHRPSVRCLLQEIVAKGVEDQLTEDELVKRFRPNLVVEGGEAYEEDSWPTLNINTTTLQIQSKCRRCQMVCVSPTTGQRSKEPMLTLTTTRGSNMWFGVHATTVNKTPGNTTTSIIAAMSTTNANAIGASDSTSTNNTVTSMENSHKKVICIGSPVYTLKIEQQE